MTPLSIFNNIWVGLMLVAMVGVFWPIPVFRRRRSFALCAFVGMFLVWYPIGKSLETPADVAADERWKTRNVGTYDDVYDHPGRYLEMDERYASDYGLVTISGTLRNTSNYPIGNARLKCVARAETGKVTDRGDITILRRVAPNSSVRFGPLRVGVVDDQAVSVYCQIIRAELLPGAATSAVEP